MISITNYLYEIGFLEKLDQKFQKTAFATKADEVNKKIDNFLDKTAIGRAYMKAENVTGEVFRKSANSIANLNDRIQRRNFIVRK